MEISEIRVGIRGGGDIASGVAWRLHQCGFRVFIMEVPQPLAVRRMVSFCEAIYEKSMVVEGVEAVLVHRAEEIPTTWQQGKIPVIVDPHCEARHVIRPEVIVDGILAKKNLGTSIDHAPLVIALGPGFVAGKDAHFVVETNRGHDLGRLISAGSAEPDTGVPGAVLGITTDRVLRAPADGIWEATTQIGRVVEKGDAVGAVSGLRVTASISGLVRGLIRPGIRVTKGLKIGDIDPRGEKISPHTISEKALAISGGVLEGILRVYARK